MAKVGWIKAHQHWLDDGQIENLVTSLRSISFERPELEDHIRTETNYFEANAEPRAARQMCYPRFRSRGFFVGTGVMEAACKTIIGGRLKRSGIFWTVRGANSIIALRCCRLSGNFEDYWERRRGPILHFYVARPTLSIYPNAPAYFLSETAVHR